eukprot:jgi/Botrbrau1/12710/Bobra.67_1s0073.1
MSWDFLVWLISFVLQAGLLGFTMYGLITISDLEQDYLNPHDAADALNPWVAPEVAVQAVLGTILLIAQKWLFGPVHAAVAAFSMRRYLRGEATSEPTDIWDFAKKDKYIRMYKLIFYLVSFVYIIYRMVESAIHAIDGTPESNKMVHKLLQEAAATL